MQNFQLGEIFRRIAELLELKGENPFKVRAYEKGARTLERLAEPVERIHANGGLESIEGIGKGLGAKIAELLSTGRSSLLEELEADFPPQILDIMRVPGIGPKKSALLYREHGIGSIDDLESALRAGTLDGAKGFGRKAADQILAGIAVVRSIEGLHPLNDALDLADLARERLAAAVPVRAFHALGEMRRRCETPSALELLLVCDDPQRSADDLSRIPGMARLGADQLSCELRGGVSIAVRVCGPSCEGARLVWHTGSARHIAALQALAHEKGRAFTADGVEGFPAEREEDVYHALDLPFIPPELRETGDEVSRAREGKLPDLVTLDDVQGDLHCHTTSSDGADSLEDMVAAAMALSYRYIAITDHSQSLKVARGLETERLKAQWGRIDQFNVHFDGLRVLKSTEADILSDGSIDYPDDILADADLVVASVHSAFRMEKSEMTRRLVRAIGNPHVDILAHPTGRIIGRRPPYDADWDAVFSAAAAQGKAMEINSFPDRLDLNDVHIQEAAKKGIPCAVSTDSHSRRHLRWMPLGVATARRGWLGKEAVLNTWSVETLLSWAQRGAPSR